MRSESSHDTEQILNHSSKAPAISNGNRRRLRNRFIKGLRSEIMKIDGIDSLAIKKNLDQAYAALDIDLSLILEQQYKDYRERLRATVDYVLKTEMEGVGSRRARWQGPGWLRLLRCWKLGEIKCCREILGGISGEQVIWDLTKVIDYDPNASFAYEARGIAYVEEREFDLAFADFTQAITLNPKNAGVYINRGIAYSMSYNEELAMQDFNAAISLDPAIADGYNARGLAHFFQEEYKEALSDFSRAITIDPIESRYYTNRANSYAKLGEKELAIVDYTAAIFMNHKDAHAYANRGFVFYEKGWFRRAVRDISKAIGLGLSSENLYRKRAAAYTAMGNYAGADQDELWALEMEGKGYQG